MDKIFNNRRHLSGVYFCFNRERKILNKILRLKFLKFLFLNKVKSIGNFKITFFAIKLKNIIEIYFK